MSIWMMYAIAVAALAGLGGLAAERLALATGRATRWGWLAAMATSAVLPIALPRIARGGGAAASGSGSFGSIELVGPAITHMGAVGGAPPALERMLLVAWAVASLVLLGIFAASVLVLRRRRREWRHSVVDGASVLVSERTGPAVVGFLAPDLVVPSWILDLDENSLRLLVTHEWEHRREGDPLLLLAAIGIVIVFPWNLPIWWQARRLRLAIEVDCDSRVLRRHRDARGYGLLLLEVGRRAARSHVPVAAFIHPTSFLERRMRVLARSERISRRAALLAVLLALVPPLALYALPVPEVPDLSRAPGREQVEPEALPAVAAGMPRPDERVASGEPRAGDDSPIGRRADEQPEPGDGAVRRGSGIAVWTKPGSASGPSLRAVAVPGDTIPGESRQPTFTPFDQKPELANREDLARSLVRMYPETLKAEGIGGTTTLWVYIDESGEVGVTRIVRSSGQPLLDQAARDVMSTARFTSARLEGERVAVWIQLPVTFDARER